MATEQIVPDPRHRAIVSLNQALVAVESGNPHEAENAAQRAIAYLREIPNTSPYQATV